MTKQTTDSKLLAIFKFLQRILLKISLNVASKRENLLLQLHIVRRTAINAAGLGCNQSAYSDIGIRNPKRHRAGNCCDTGVFGHRVDVIYTVIRGNDDMRVDINEPAKMVKHTPQCVFGRAGYDVFTVKKQKV